MARRIEPPAAQAAGKAAEELDILFPERQARIGGRDVTVREYSFVEGVRLRLQAKPFSDALFALLQGREIPHYAVIQDTIAQHLDVVLGLVARAADVEVEWIEQLGQADGELLLMMWWGVNGPFFLRAALQRLRLENEVHALLAGGGSLPPSSPTATGSASSASTPSAS